MTESMASRIRRGAALLDKKRRSKAWRKKIDLDRLNMGMPLFMDGRCGCILAQTYGTYGMGLRKLGIANSDDDDMGRAQGFFPDGESMDALTRAWKRFLKAEA